MTRPEPPGSAAFEEAAQGLGPDDAVVFVDHDDPDLVPALTRVLGGQAGYVGSRTVRPLRRTEDCLRDRPYGDVVRAADRRDLHCRRCQ